MVRTGSARWQGGIRDGSGSVSTGSHVLEDAPYGFASRFAEGKGTNPEELIGAAHAGCFSMALAKILGDAGVTAEWIETRADVRLEKAGDGFEITASHLTVQAKVPGIDSARFLEFAGQAKGGCPVSRLLRANITMDAALAD